MGVMYILDELVMAFIKRDNQRLLKTLRHLKFEEHRHCRRAR